MQASLKSDWFCGVADGHGANGHFVSQFIQQHITKQYETDKRRMDRLKQAKQLASSFKSAGGAKKGEADEALNKQANSTSNMKQNGVQQDKLIRKALVQSFLQVQSKMEK